MADHDEDSSVATEQPEPQPGAPNVVLLVVDTLRADHLSGYGYGRQTTPRLDRMMSEGATFEAAVATSSWSAPSHTSIVTGVLPAKHGVHNWGTTIREGVPTLATLLWQRGYATGLFSTHRALHQSIEGICADLDEVVIRNRLADAEVLEKAVDFAQRQERPFFLYSVIMMPHAPYNRYPREDNERYFTEQPEGGERTFEFVNDKWIGDGGIPGSVAMDGRKDVGYYINRYDRAVRFCDQLIGRFVDQLDRHLDLDQTLILITSDHGEGLGEHNTFSHGTSLHEFLIHVPWIVRYPAVIDAGQRLAPMASLVDLVPTVLGLLNPEGDPTIEGFDGLDLSAVLRGVTAPAPDRVAFASIRHKGYQRHMARTSRYKLLFDARQKQRQFFDLNTDPDEQNNLLSGSRSPEQAQALKELRAQLKDYLASETDPPEVPTQTLSEDVLDELRALGYAE